MPLTHDPEAYMNAASAIVAAIDNPCACRQAVREHLTILCEALLAAARQRALEYEALRAVDDARRIGADL